MPRLIRDLTKAVLTPLVQAARPRRTDLPAALWRLERDEEGYLTLNSVRLEGLLERWGSPLHLLDVRRLNENIAEFREVPAGGQGGCEVYYSYKSNPVPAVLSHMHARGIGAEVISAYELWLALRLGVPADRIVFNGPGRTPESLKLAVERGVLIQLNNREEVARVARIAHEVGRKARVGIRVTSALGWNGQFGESIPSGAAMACFRDADRRPDLELIAIHCHHGEELATDQQLRAHLHHLVQLLAALRYELGFEPEIVDLGGSLASQTVSSISRIDLALNRTFGADLVPRDPTQVLSIRRYIARVVADVEQSCRLASIPRPRIFVEPGRAMTGNTQMLLCRVLNLKGAVGGGPVHAVLDAGVNIAEPVRNRYHQLFPLGPRGGRAQSRYRVVGPICTPMDVLYPNWELPELRRGEALAIMDSGAYFVPFSTSFAFPQPAIVALEGREEHLVRRRESFDDLVRRDLPADLTISLPDPTRPTPPDERLRHRWTTTAAVELPQVDLPR